MLNRDIDSIISQSYSKLGEMGLAIARNRNNGFDKSQQQNKLKNKLFTTRLLLKVVLDHVSFNDAGKVQYLLRTSDVQMNKFLKELIKITDIQDYPVAPLLFHKAKPKVLNQGPPGPPGTPGADGSDATVDVIPNTGEDQIEVTEEDISDIRTFKLKLNLYVAPELEVLVQGVKEFEVGRTVNNLQINVNTRKGRNNVQSIVSSFNNTLFQSILNLVTVNGNTQPVTTSFVVSGITADNDFTFTLTDNSGKPAGIVVKSDSVRFYRPYIFGASDSLTPDHYQLLNRLVAPKQNVSLPLDGDNKYFWIGYPVSYGQAIRILDQYGINRFDDFTEVLANVTSQNLDANWTIQYRFYRTIQKTTIETQSYRLQFTEFDEVDNNGFIIVGGGGGGGVTDHGALTGLGDDDHTQYHTDARGDARYYTKSQVDSSLAGKADSTHGHAISDVSGLQTALDGKAALTHSHAISDVTGLQTQLDSKIGNEQSIINALIFG